MSLDWKAHGPTGKQMASCRFAGDAAAIVALYGDGATIKYNGRIVYREKDGLAGESLDAAAQIAIDTRRKHQLEYIRKHNPSHPILQDVSP